MSYNKYNSRNSGRFNTTGQFVAAGDPVVNNSPAQNYSTFQSPSPAPPPPPPKTAVSPAATDVDMKVEQSDSAEDNRPPWMKARLLGVKKISNKERRRRQNENLRKLLTPKSALMVLNEIMPKEQVSNQFHVENVGHSGHQYYRTNAAQSFCADLTLDGNSYKGYGETKLTARNAAAEQAVRDLILRKMARVLLPEPAEPAEPAAGGEAGAEAEAPDAEAEEETLPMIQLASFALHKLFSEWEYEGHRVPQLRTPNPSVSETASEAEAGAAPPKAKAPKPRALPDNAASMHPSMLLAYMRPQLEYRELGVQGGRPPHTLFTMGIDVDGTTYTGTASNKKEARKQAARAACTALFGVTFDAV
ncbi:double-stranded RNA-specific editase 1-like isoform X2 [Pararge aegeria]|uniref:double-stranded RNA-specific editase 1-like isoform X2 n=1 Tax=Pararge aegeria TaxID=116150 RepID=UPI0019D02702|nr:double-stranded RNA-specific editase 1-like isoform X2 [Pararge aegeria]